MSAPDWNVAIVDGEPTVVVNLAALAQMVAASPLGVERAMERMRSALSPDCFAALQMEVAA